MGQVSPRSLAGRIQILHFGLSLCVRGSLKGTAVKVHPNFLLIMYTLGFPSLFLLTALAGGQASKPSPVSEHIGRTGRKERFHLPPESGASVGSSPKGGSPLSILHISPPGPWVRASHSMGTWCLRPCCGGLFFSFACQFLQQAWEPCGGPTLVLQGEKQTYGAAPHLLLACQ